MNSVYKHLMSTLFAVCAIFMSAVSFADAQQPRAMIEAATVKLLTIAQENAKPDTDVEVFYKNVRGVLDGMVDFRYIAASVMGKTAYNQATPEQRAQFIEVFKDGLVKSYAKGIAGYAQSEINVVDAATDAKNPNRAVVRQEVAHEGAVHQLSYTLRRTSAESEWKLINVVLNGVNLGQSFSSQFSSALRKESNDIDKVIANWLAES